MIALQNIDIDLWDFTVDDVAMAPQANYDLELDLEKDGYTIAEITFWIKGTSSQATARYKSAFILATRTLNECYGQTNREYWNSFTWLSSTYSNCNWRYQGFSYATDARLSEAEYDKNGNAIKIIHAHIDGKTLKIRFNNTFLSNTAYLRLEGRVRASRAEMV